MKTTWIVNISTIGAGVYGVVPLDEKGNMGQKRICNNSKF